MKKLFAILLALLMMSACAFAEENVKPVGDTVENAVQNGIFMISLTDENGEAISNVYMDELPDDAALTYDETVGEDGMWIVDVQDVADVRIFITPCGLKMAQGVSMADVTGDNLQQLQDMATIDYDDPVVEMMTTPSGNQYMHIYERDEELRNVCTIFTLYKGAIIELVQFNDDFAPLTEADHEIMETVLHNIWVYDVK